MFWALLVVISMFFGAMTAVSAVAVGIIGAVQKSRNKDNPAAWPYIMRYKRLSIGLIIATVVFALLFVIACVQEYGIRLL